MHYNRLQPVFVHFHLRCSPSHWITFCWVNYGRHFIRMDTCSDALIKYLQIYSQNSHILNVLQWLHLFSVYFVYAFSTLLQNARTHYTSREILVFYLALYANNVHLIKGGSSINLEHAVFALHCFIKWLFSINTIDFWCFWLVIRPKCLMKWVGEFMHSIVFEMYCVTFSDNPHTPFISLKFLTFAGFLCSSLSFRLMKWHGKWMESYWLSLCHSMCGACVCLKGLSAMRKTG